MALTRQVVDQLNQFFGGGFSLGDSDTFCWFEGNLAAAKRKSAGFGETLDRLEAKRVSLVAQNAILEREIVEMGANSGKAEDALFALVREEQEEFRQQHPGAESLPFSVARKRVVKAHRQLAERAGLTAPRPRPGENSDHYQQEFFRRAGEIEKAEGCSFRESRLRAAARWPKLRAAAFGGDARTRYFSAVEFEAEANKLDLSQAYRAVAGRLPMDAQEVL